MSEHAIAEWLLFTQAFFKHPRDVSSIIPTREAVAERIAARIREKGPQVIVEYGPATGPVSQKILRGGRLAKGSQFILIEKAPEFIDHLRHSLRDSCISIFNASAEDVLSILQKCGVEKADYIFSGVPLSSMPFAAADRIVRSTHAALKDDGVFVQYAFRRTVEVLLDKYFPNVRSSTELFNVPPLTVYEARKR